MKIQITKLPKNRYDIGGVLQSHGSDWSDGLVTIGAGGSHEENKYQGVQVGVDAEGTPNLVEENETIYNDYVYSNRITLDDEAKKAFHIGKKRDITYAEMSKKLEKEAAERPNDPISKAALKVQMQDLADHQERQKQEMETERAREAFEALSPEEQTAVMQQVAQQEQAAQEQAMQEEAMAQQQAQSQQMQMSPEEAAMMQQQQMQRVPTADAMGAVAQPMVEAYGGEVNRFDFGGLAWVKKNHPEVKNPQKIAAAIEKYISLHPKWRDSAGNISYNNISFNNAWRDLGPSMYGKDVAKKMQMWVEAGLDRDTAFNIVYPDSVITNKGGGKEGREKAIAERNAAYKELVTDANKVQKSSVSKPVYGTSASGLHTKTIDGVTQYRGADGNYYYNEKNALATRKQEAPKKEEKGGKEVSAQKQETIAAKPVEVKSNTDAPKAKVQVVPKSNTTKASTNDSNGINVGTYRQEGNQWNAYGLPGLQDYLNRAFVDYDTAEDADKQQIAQNIVDTLNGVQQSYWDNIVPTLGQERQQRNAGVGNHQTLYNDVTNNAGFKGIDPITGQIYDRTDEAIIMPEGHNTSDNLANGWVDEYSGPKTWLRYLGASGDDLDAVVQQLRSRGIDYSPYQDWTIGEGDNARQLYRASLLNSPVTENEGFPEDATQFGDRSNYAIEVNDNAGTDDFVEVDANGNPIASIGNGGNENRKVVPVLRDERLRYAGLFGPAIGLGMQALGIGRPNTKAFDGVINAYDKTGASFADYKPIGNYITYNPLDTWAGLNRLNANARATDRAIMNSGVTQGSKVAGLLANEYNNQIGSGNLFRQAQEYNDNLKKQVAEFNRGTDQFNAQAYNQLAQFNASQRDRDRQMRAQLGMQAAAQKADMDAGWYNGIYGNVAGLFKGISDLGRENAERNMLARLAASGALGTIKPESAVNAGLLKYADEAAEGGKIKRKKSKRRGLTI